MIAQNELWPEVPEEFIHIDHNINEMHEHLPLALPSMMTERRFEVTQLAARGFTNKQIAEELDIAPQTVKTHLKWILPHTRSVSRYGLANLALHNGWIEYESQKYDMQLPEVGALVLKYVAFGFSDGYIGPIIDMTEESVAWHLKTLKKAMALKGANRIQIITRGYEAGLFAPPPLYGPEQPLTITD